MAESTFGQVLESAISQRGVTLTWLSRRLGDLGDPVSVATLSLWRSGKRLPHSDAAVDVLLRIEEILHLPSHQLVDQVPPRPRPGPDRFTHVSRLTGAETVTREYLSHSGIPSGRIAIKTSWTVVEVGADRRLVSSTSTQTWEAQIDGVGEVPLYWRFDSVPLDEPQLVGVSGGEIRHRTFHHPERMLAAELVLPRTLLRGETAATKYTFLNLSEESEATKMFMLQERRLTSGTLWVRFHPTALPRTVWAFHEFGSGVQERERSELIGGAADTSVDSFGPGRWGLEWVW